MQQIPFVSLLHFYHRFSTGSKRLFIVLFAIMLLASAWVLYGTYMGADAGLEYTVMEDLTPHPVSWSEASPDHPLLALKGNAYTRYGIQIPGMLMGSNLSIWLWLIFIITGWSAVLTAISRLQTYWNLIPVFLFAVWLRMGGVGEKFFGTDPYYLLTLAIALVFIACIYYFQRLGQRSTLSIQFLVYTALLILLFGVLYWKGGLPLVSAFQAGTMPFFYLLSCATILYVSREPVLIITAFLTNQPKVQQRASLPILSLVWFLWLLLLLFLFLKFEGFLAAPVGVVSPAMILMLALIAAPFTAQNGYHVLRHVYGSNIAFTLNHLAAGIWTTATLAYAYASGEWLIIHQADRMITSAFLLMGALQLLYIIINFYPLLRQKVNVYFVLLMPVKFRFFIVWLTLIVSLSIIEGFKSWKSVHILSAVSENQTADALYRMGYPDSARTVYASALMFTSGDPKANYNLGLLSLLPNTDPQPAIDKMRVSARVFPEFKAGDLQSAWHLNFIGRKKQAMEILDRRYRQHPDPITANTLAWYYFQASMPDSAITCLKYALAEDPSFADGYANLALIYLSHNKAAEAEIFLQHALESSSGNPDANTNLLYYQLISGQKDPLIWKQTWSTLAASEGFLTNAMYWNQWVGNPQVADLIAAKLESEAPGPEVLLYRATRCMQADSVPQALSRHLWMQRNHFRYAGLSAHNIASLYYAKGVPEMAEKIWADYAREEHTSALVMRGMMQAIIGQQDSAYRNFSLARINTDSVADYARKECALILFANDKEMYARYDWDFANARYQDWIRGAKYALAANQVAPAMEMLRNAIGLDSSRFEPYALLAEWMLAKEDTQAISIYQDGLAVFPDHPSLKAGYIRALRAAGQATFANTIRKSWTTPDTQNVQVLLMITEELAQAGKTQSVIELLSRYHKQHPLDIRVIIPLAHVLSEAGDAGEATRWLYTILEMNDQNPDVWYYYALLASQAGYKEQAGFGAIRTLFFLKDAQRKSEIEKQFATEIQAWRQKEY